jgi:hypothetical protein
MQQTGRVRLAIQNDGVRAPKIGIPTTPGRVGVRMRWLDVRPMPS